MGFRVVSSTAVRSWRRELLMLAVTAAALATARSSLADHYLVPTGSMLPTVEPEDHVLVDKMAYGLRLPFTGEYVIHSAPPGRGDVVVLQSPEDGTVLLKRVVAVPGDRVTVSDGALVIDGRSIPIVTRGGADIEELGTVDHAVSFAAGGGPDYGPRQIPTGRYLVLGDNRGNSRDGRWFGLVSRDAILGRVQRIIVRHGSPAWLGLSSPGSHLLP
jgi:signal peptidase I